MKQAVAANDTGAMAEECGRQVMAEDNRRWQTLSRRQAMADVLTRKGLQKTAPTIVEHRQLQQARDRESADDSRQSRNTAVPCSAQWHHAMEIDRKMRNTCTAPRSILQCHST
ncbi:unnamed protein product [Citrullus colocynthis]|uniref:Uncharacterized protein n=1 Tax=Citrullus colocynthis TaxID=252529 RepID=A0ABP0XYH1_9ROSI